MPIFGSRCPSRLICDWQSRTGLIYDEDTADCSETEMDFMTPAAFDILVIVNIAVGAVIAGRRLVKDIRGPLPDDAPAWAHETYDSSSKATTDS